MIQDVACGPGASFLGGTLVLCDLLSGVSHPQNILLPQILNWCHQQPISLGETLSLFKQEMLLGGLTLLLAEMHVLVQAEEG